MKDQLHIKGLLVAAIMFVCVPISSAEQNVLSFWGNGQVLIQQHLRPEYVPGELLVKFREETPRATMEALHSAVQVQETRRIGPFGVERIKFPSDISVEEAVSLYETDPNVEYAEPN
ncbi:MAG TPA: hypothetical protein EYP19_15340 [Desulfobacterales bacterium]|nr:hypothetical protein [Desulfobacterales bacterium]